MLVVAWSPIEVRELALLRRVARVGSADVVAPAVQAYLSLILVAHATAHAHRALPLSEPGGLQPVFGLAVGEIVVLVEYVVPLSPADSKELGFPLGAPERHGRFNWHDDLWLHHKAHESPLA